MRRHRFRLAWAALVALGCGGVAPPPPAKPAPEPAQSAPVATTAVAKTPAPQLRTGAFPARFAAAPLELTARVFYRGAGFSVVGMDLPLSRERVKAIQSVRLPAGGVAVPSTGALFGDTQGAPAPGPVLWAFVPGPNPLGLHGTLLLDGDGLAGEVVPFRLGGSLPRSDRAALAAWADRAGDWYRAVETPYHQFAASRIATAFGPVRSNSRAEVLERARELVERAMANDAEDGPIEHGSLADSAALAAWAKATPTLPLAGLSPPERLALPFEQWRTTKAPPALGEPLAASTPKDFFYLRASSPPALLTLVDDEGLLALGRTTGHAEAMARDLTARYLTELGLSRVALDELARGAVLDVALVGSELEFSRGTDVTLLFQVNDAASFSSALERARGAAELPAPTPLEPREPPAGVAIQRGPNGAPGGFRYHLLHERVAALSNSEQAIRRVRDVLLGNRPSLADDLGFAYLLERSPMSSDALAFVGDAFIDAYDSPQRSVQRARAALAAIELTRPNYAALLYRELMGRDPSDVRELASLGLLEPGEKRHADGARLTYSIGEPASSPWGRGHHRRPPLDGPPITRVSALEQAAYENLKQRRELGQASFRGPLLARIGLRRHETRLVGLSVRVHTLPVSPEYANFAADAQGQGLSVSPFAGGLRVLGLSPTSSLAPLGRLGWQGELCPPCTEGEAPPASPVLDGLCGPCPRDGSAASGGDASWIRAFLAGASDDFRLAHAVRALGLAPEPPLTTPAPPPNAAKSALAELARLGALPLYLVLDERESEAPGERLAEWFISLGLAPHDAGKHLGHAITRWSYSRVALCGAHACSIELYAAKRGGQRLLALDISTLRKLLDQPTFERTTRPESGPHLVYQLASAPGGAFETLLEWYFESRRRERADTSRALAEVWLKSTDSRERDAHLRAAHRFFGGIPVTPEGALFESLDDGLNDPLRGTPASPVWPELPLRAGTDIGTRLFTHVDLRVEFRKEGSLSGTPVHGVVFELRLGQP